LFFKPAMQIINRRINRSPGRPVSIQESLCVKIISINQTGKKHPNKKLKLKTKAFRFQLDRQRPWKIGLRQSNNRLWIIFV